MANLAERLNTLSESQTIKMASISRELTLQGFDMINLSLGEPDFPTPTYIKEAAKKAIDDGFTFYTPISGYADLRQAISNKFKTQNNLDFPPDQIVVSTGAKQSIANVVLSLINPGDEVIMPRPYWVSYVEIVKVAQGTTTYIDTTVDSDFKITPEDLQKSIGPKTKLFIFSSPCNPTGTVYSREELAALAEVFRKNPHVYILSDEIYEHINFLGEHYSIAQFEFLKDRVIVINGVSKGYAMTGWRIGYMGAPREIAKACDKIQGQFTSGTSSVSQRAALAALTGDIAPTIKMKEAFLRRRDMVLSELRKIEGIKVNVPEGAFYVFPDISAFFGKKYGDKVIKTAEDLSFYLLYNAHVTVVTGEAFGAPECIRISYAASDEKLLEAMKRIKQSLSELS